MTSRRENEQLLLSVLRTTTTEKSISVEFCRKYTDTQDVSALTPMGTLPLSLPCETPPAVLHSAQGPSIRGTWSCCSMSRGGHKDDQSAGEPLLWRQVRDMCSTCRREGYQVASLQPFRT